MLHLPLYGHTGPLKYRPKVTGPLTEDEKDFYHHNLTTLAHIYEPSLSLYLKHVQRPLPELLIQRKAPINTLPFNLGKIGHKDPVPTYDPKPTLTLAYVYSEGVGLPHYLCETADPSLPYPPKVSYEDFIQLIRFWQIPLLDALDYILWEYKRTNGLIPIYLDLSELPRHPEVLDWIDEFTRTPINSVRY